MLNMIFSIFRKKNFLKPDITPEYVRDVSSDFIVQSGVIPYSIEEGKVKIVLITSRNGKKWILPKGFIEDGMSPSESAEKEAMEEAGINGSVSERSAGFYEYKRDGQNYRVYLFPMHIKTIEKLWPESGSRQRIIIDIDSAYDYINDRGISDIIHRFFSGTNFFQLY